jgi:hypothetical protein
MNQQAMRQAARRSALDAQAVLRKQRADREHRLEGLAVAVLTALGERDAAVRDTERRASEALQTMTIDEGLSLRDSTEAQSIRLRREFIRLAAIGRTGVHLLRPNQPEAVDAGRPRPRIGFKPTAKRCGTVAGS